MVCDKCKKKLKPVACPEPWKSGSMNSAAGSKGRKLNENKMLARNKGKQARDSPLAKRCKFCKQKISQGVYCHDCSYKKGVCSMCGKVILDTTYYKQSTV